MKQQKLEIVRERGVVFKPTTKENLVLFVVQKLYIKYKNFKDGLSINIVCPFCMLKEINNSS